MNSQQLLNAKNGVMATIGPEQTIQEAAKIFAGQRLGALMVMDADETLRGILSERDVVKGLDKYGTEVLQKSVLSLCTERVITCTPETGLVDLLALMESHQIRNLPVIEDNHLTGVITQGDVMDAWIAAFDEENEQLRDQLSS